MTIGLISDTHGFLDPRIASYFANCQEILHAGDVGPVSVLEQLDEIKPTSGVYGNIDGHEVRSRCPQDLWLKREGLLILVTHIAGRPGRYDKRVRAILKGSKPDMLICGHSHILRVERDPIYHNMLYINPGAAGKHGFHHKKTIVRLTLEQKRISDLEVIDLGKRGSLTTQ